MEPIISVLENIHVFITNHPALEVSCTLISALVFTFVFDIAMSKLKPGNPLLKPYLIYILRIVAFSLGAGIGLLGFADIYHIGLTYGIVTIGLSGAWLTSTKLKKIDLYLVQLFLATTLYLFFDMQLLAFVEQAVIPTIVFSVFADAYKGYANNIGSQMAVLWGNRPQE